jgi:hypothetical protein
MLMKLTVNRRALSNGGSLDEAALTSTASKRIVAAVHPRSRCDPRPRADSRTTTSPPSRLHVLAGHGGQCLSTAV